MSIRSRRDEILDAQVTAIAETGVLNNADRSRVRVLRPDQLPSGTVYPVSESVDYDASTGRVLRTLRTKVALRSIGGEPEIDPLHVATVGALAGNQYNDLAIDTREVGTEWVFEEADNPLIGCDIEFEVTYFTAEADEGSAG